MKRTRWSIVITLVATLLFFWLALDSMVADSPTMDEQNHIARGLALLRTGDPRLSLEHPPFTNMLGALPLLTLPEITLPTDHPSWTRPQGWYEFAELLLWQYNHDVTRMVFLARLPIVFLTIGLALTALRFARHLWGWLASLLAYVAILFDPNILAHGRYATTDLGGTLFVFLAAYALWRLWGRPHWDIGRLLWAALALGLAYSSKLSALAFAPLFALLAVLPLYGGSAGWRDSVRRLAQYAIVSVLALVVIWVTFGLQWGALQFAGPQLSQLNSISAPMPTFWSGVEQILLLSEGGRPSFLLGETSVSGFAAYFPVAFLVKTPFPALLLFALAIILLLVFPADKMDRRRATYLLLPALLYFVLSMQSGLNIGYRHLLPILPFLYVAGSGAAARLVERVQSPRLPSSARSLAVGGLVAALVVPTLLVHPHYLSFFNAMAGGPDNGYRILVDSNVDWGQDLFRLQTWMREHDVTRINLSWFGSADPAYYGLQYDPLPGLPRHFDLWWDVPFDPSDPRPGIYAISVSNLWELPLQEEKFVFPWFRRRPPDDRVAYSILIYEVK